MSAPDAAPGLPQRLKLALAMARYEEAQGRRCTARELLPQEDVDTLEPMELGPDPGTEEIERRLLRRPEH